MGGPLYLKMEDIKRDISIQKQNLVAFSMSRFQAFQRILQQIKVLAESYPKVVEVLERVREPKVVLEFNRREDGK